MTLWTCPRCGHWVEVHPVETQVCEVCRINLLNRTQITAYLAERYPLRVSASLRESLPSRKRN